MSTPARGPVVRWADEVTDAGLGTLTMGVAAGGPVQWKHNQPSDLDSDAINFFRELRYSAP